MIKIHIEELPEGLYLATAEDLPGLVAQGRTVAETLDFARDIARKLIEARKEQNGSVLLPTVKEHSDYVVVVES